MKELHLNPFRFASKTTTNLHSNKGADSKWFAQNNNGLSSNGFQTNFKSCKLDCQQVHRIGDANLTYRLPLVFTFLSLSFHKSE